MGLRVSALRTTVTGCGRIVRMDQASRGLSAAAAASPPRLHPPLAVRAGVEAAGMEEGQAAERQPGRQQKREKRAPPPRPTHFLALQVSQHAAATGAIAAVQAALCSHSPHLSEACVEAASAHLTLGVMALHGEESRAGGAAALAALGAELEAQALRAPVEVSLSGLSHFNNQVLYLDVQPDGGLQQLQALATATRAHFAAAGMLLQADRPFVPHVTIAKTSKLQGGWGAKRGRGGGGYVPPHGGRGGRGHSHGRDWKAGRQAQQQLIDAEAWAPLVGIDGGRALLTEIQLCAMQGRQPGGYYPVLASLPLLAAAVAVAAGSAGEHSEQQQQQQHEAL